MLSIILAIVPSENIGLSRLVLCFWCTLKTYGFEIKGESEMTDQNVNFNFLIPS